MRELRRVVRSARKALGPIRESVVQTLERRRLLSAAADASALSVAFGRTTIPSSVVTGVNDHGLVTLTITNNGSAPVRAATPVSLYASADGTVDSSAVLIETINHTTTLKAGKSGPLTANVKSLPATLDGNYTLVVQLTDPATSTTVDAAGPTVAVAPAVISFSEVLVSSKVPTGNGKGKNAGSAKLTITNNGNAVSKGRTTIRLYASSDGSASDGTLLKTQFVSLPLKPGTGRTLNIPLTKVPSGVTGNQSIVVVVTDPQGHTTTTGSLPTAAISQFALPSGSRPQQIVEGPDGNLYCTDAGANAIDRITPQGVVTQFAIPTPNAGVTGLAVGSDDNIWFAEAAPGVNAIAAVNTAGNFSIVTPIPIPTANSAPTGLTSGPDGNIWFTEQNGNKIAIVNVINGVITEYAVPTADSGPTGITSAGGELWFTEKNAGKIGALTTAGVFSEYPLGNPAAQPLGIIAGPDGNVWFTEENAGQVGTITPAGVITTYGASPTPGSGPYDITAGADGTLYFTASLSGNIGQMTTNGSLTQYAISDANNAAPQAICAGPRGTVWFVDAGSASVEVLSPA